MKTIITAFLLSALFLIACSSPKPLIVNDGDTVVDQIEAGITGGKVRSKLYSRDKADTVESSIEYMFYTNTDLPYQDTVNRIIKEYISGVVSNGGGITEQNSDLSVEYFEEAMGKFKDEYNKQIEFVEGGGVWTTETLVEVIEENSDYVEISFHNWNYMGGAHGSTWSEQRIIEKKTGRELKLVDFFSDVNELTAKAEVIFRADQEIPAGANLEEAGFWFEDGVFKLNENFVINDESINFLYNQYEIAPYAAGVIFIEIPMKGIKHLLIK